LRIAREKEPELDYTDMSLYAAYGKLRGMIPSSGFGPNPICPADYHFFINELGGANEVSHPDYDYSVMDIVTVFGIIDDAYLRLAAEKQKSSENSKAKPKTPMPRR